MAAINIGLGSTTILSGASLSGAVRGGGATLVRVTVPAAWTAANLQILGSDDGVTFVPLRDIFGTLIQIAAAAGQGYQVPPAMVHGWEWLQLQSVTSGAVTTATVLTPVAQAADRVLPFAVEVMTR